MGKSLRLFLLMMALFMIPVFVAQTTCGAAELRIGFVGEPNTLMANDSTDYNAMDVSRQIFERLIFMDMSMAFHPELATSWDVNPDNIIFHLRKGVKFHDGTPLNAEAVKFSFDRIVSENLKLMGRIRPFFKSIEVIDDYTVKMNVIGSPQTALAGVSVFGVIESPAVVKKYDKKDLPTHPEGGTGPYKFVEWLPHQRIVLEANKEYWGGAPKLDRVIFRPVPDPQTRVAMVQAGDLDVIVNPPITEVPRLKAQPALKLMEVSSSDMLFLAFNNTKAPFSDKRVRQALSYAIDRKGIVNTLVFGRLDSASGWLRPGMTNVKTSDAYPYNPEKAKSMLAELGWKPGPGGILEKDGKPFKTVFVTPSGRYLMDVQITEGIQAQLKKIGVETSVSIVEGATFMQWQMTDYEGKSKADTGLWLITLTTGPEAGMSMGNNVYSGSMPPRGSNYFMWKNEEFDQVLVAAGKEFDAAKRGQLLQKAQDILAEEVPILPIYVCKNILALRKGVNGVEFRNPFDFYRVSEKAYIE